MAWTTPMTATSNSTLTAAQWNTHVRDNLLETGPAKATAAGRLLVTDGANSITERVVGHAYIGTAQSTTSSTFTDLSTPGPAVSVVTGTTAVCWWSVQAVHGTQNTGMQTSIAVTGASSIDPSTAGGDALYNGLGANAAFRVAQVHVFDTLTPGTNTFTVKYQCPSGTSAQFSERLLVVMAL